MLSDRSDSSGSLVHNPSSATSASAAAAACDSGSEVSDEGYKSSQGGFMAAKANAQAGGHPDSLGKQLQQGTSRSAKCCFDSINRATLHLEAERYMLVC